MLKGDASNRRFWRVAVDAAPSGAASTATPPASAIAVDLGPDDLPAYVRALKLVSGPPSAARASLSERAALSQIDRRGGAGRLRRGPGAPDAAGRGRWRAVAV